MISSQNVVGIEQNRQATWSFGSSQSFTRTGHYALKYIDVIVLNKYISIKGNKAK